MELMGTLVVRDKSDPIQNVMMLTGLEEEFRKIVGTNVNAQIENLIGCYHLPIIKKWLL